MLKLFDCACSPSPSPSPLPLPPSLSLFPLIWKDLLVYLSVQDMLDSTELSQLVWQLEEVTYGTWEDGPHGDSTWSKTLQLDVPEV